MKKLVILVSLSILCVFSLVGCGSSDEIADPTVTPPQHDFRIRVELTSTTIWADLRIQNEQHIISAELISVSGNPTYQDASPGGQAIDQSDNAAKNGNEVGISVEYEVAWEAIDDGLDFRLQRDDLNGCIVRIYHIVEKEPQLIYELDHEDETGLDDKNTIDLTFDLRTMNVTQIAVPSTVEPTTSSFPSLQLENNLPQTLLSLRPPKELQDNHIGVHTEGFGRYSEATEDVITNGFKRLRIQSLTQFGEDEGFGVKTFLLDSIPPVVDEVINNYIDNGVMISLDLWLGTGYPINFTDYDTNYKSEEEIDAYLDYVELVVQHFKGRISSYEILNEPGYISIETYTNLIKRTVPVIREIDPEAKIIIGSTPGSWENGFPGYGQYQRFEVDIGMLNELIQSGVVSMVDAVSWHPFYDNIPGDPYYQDYPQIVQGIKDLATSQGFSGEYFADEILWRTVTEEGFDGGPPLSRLIAAKYYTRAIAEHRGLGLNVTINIFFQSPFLAPIHNLNNTLAGAEPTDITLSLTTDEDTNIRYYAFALPGGDKLVAAWTNDEAVEDDPGVSATLTFPDSSAEKVTGIDVFNGFEQELITENDNGNLVIRDLLVKDYPILLRFSE